MTTDELGKIVGDLAKNVDKLAIASHKEFTAIHQEFSVVHDEMRNVMRAVEGVDLHLSSYASRWAEDFSKLHDWVQELDNRVKFLEKVNPGK